MTFLDFISDPIGFFVELSHRPGADNLSGGFFSFVSGARLVFIILSVLLFAFFLYSFAKGLQFRPRFSARLRPASEPKGFTLRNEIVMQRWQGIMAKLERGGADALRIAMVDADKLVDDVLKNMGLNGEHMADRLEKLSVEEFRTIDRLWRAHRMRNQVVHEPGFEVAPHDVRRAIDAYEAFLKEVKALR